MLDRFFLFLVGFNDRIGFLGSFLLRILEVVVIKNIDKLLKVHL